MITPVPLLATFKQNSKKVKVKYDSENLHREIAAFSKMNLQPTLVDPFSATYRRQSSQVSADTFL